MTAADLLFDTLAEFERSLGAIRWFCRVGLMDDDSADRLASWEDWAGPEAHSVQQLFDPLSELIDPTMNLADSTALQAIFDRVRSYVMDVASACVPYDPNEDAWHAPTTAVWHAGSLAGLMAMYVALGREAPPNVPVQWSWFCRGHWPAALAAPHPHSHSDRLVVL